MPREEAIRSVSTAVLASVIANRDDLESVADFDEEAAKVELNRILDQHAEAIAGLSVSEVLRLAAASRSDVDPGIYQDFLKALDDEALAAEARANADELAGIRARLADKKALAEDLKATAIQVARGALMAALMAAI